VLDAAVDLFSAAVAAVAVVSAAAALGAAAATALKPVAVSTRGRAACVFGAFFAPLNTGDPPLLFTLALMCIRQALNALFGNRVLVISWAVRGGVWRPAGKVKALDTAACLEDHPTPTACSDARQILL
jgi:hypothetical protein